MEVTATGSAARSSAAVTRREQAEAEARHQTIEQAQWIKEATEADPQSAGLLRMLYRRVSGKEVLALQAAHHGEWCGLCAEDFDGRVYRRHLVFAECVVPICAACTGEPSFSRRVGECVCGKTVYSANRPRRFVFCCEQHRRKLSSAARRNARALHRNKRCAACNGSFMSTRSDGRYCTNACRQRAYRRRAAKVP